MDHLDRPLCSELNEYLRGPQSSLIQCLITLKFIASQPGLSFVFREKNACFNSLIDKDLLDNAVLTLIRKLLNDIDGSKTFFATNGPISAKYFLN